MHLQKRAAAPLILNTLVFLVVLILVMVPPDVLGGDLFFAITLICVAISGFCTAFLQGGVFGLAGLLPPMYMQAVMGGNGLAGVMVSVSSVLSQAIGAPPSSNESECDAPMRPYEYGRMHVACMPLPAWPIPFLAPFLFLHLPVLVWWARACTYTRVCACARAARSSGPRSPTSWCPWWC